MDIVEKLNVRYSIKDLIEKDIAVRIKTLKDYRRLQNLIVKESYIELVNESMVLHVLNNDRRNKCVYIKDHILSFHIEGSYSMIDYTIIDISSVVR